MKACFKCGASKPLSGFYRHNMMGDGHLGKCIECTKVDVRQNYAETREQRSAYEAKRAKTPERRAYQRKQEQLHRLRHPDKAAARSAVSRAIIAGKLVRGPCARCGSAKKVQAHHVDYSKPLDVVWLCFPCHRFWHGQVVVAKEAP